MHIFDGDFIITSSLYTYPQKDSVKIASYSNGA